MADRERTIRNTFDLETRTTRAGAVEALRRAFAEFGLASPALDARLLVADATGLGPVDLVSAPEVVLSDEDVARVVALARRRLAREPIARILGRAEFWSLPFRLSPETLVPRPDTETLVEAILDRVLNRDAALSVLDLGTGSGCLLVALLTELPGATGVGIDRSPGALNTARLNARQNRVAARAGFVAADWAAPLVGPTDILVSNPPYISTAALADLDAEVAGHDPKLALDGGTDGLDSLRRVFAAAVRLLRPGGLAVVEIGFDQEADATALAGCAGLVVDEVRADLGGHPRALVARQP